MLYLIRNILRDLFPKFTIEDSIYREVPLRKAEVLWILNEGIRIHQQYIRRKDDDETMLGTDLMHESWINIYNKTILLIQGQTVPGFTKEQAVERYEYDANEHLRIVNEGTASDTMGDTRWQIKWYFRWLSVASYVENL